MDMQGKLRQSDRGAQTVPGASTYAQISRRLLPLLFVCYFACYLDRVNVGFAKLQMATDLGFSDTVYGLGAGMFFLGYLAFETPSNLILYRVGARRWLARIMLSWAVISAGMMFVRTPGAFYVMRFLLGVAEAGFFPGVIVYLTQWYPARQRGRVIALFMTGIPISGLIGGPLSGGIMAYMAGSHGLASWQWLYVLEAIPSVVLGLLLLMFLPESVESVSWLSDKEKAHVAGELSDEEKEKGERHSFRETFTNRKLWLCVAINFSIVASQYGISFWMPTIIKHLGVNDDFVIGCVVAVPYAAAVVSMILLSRSADRTRERRWHLAVPSLVGAIAFYLVPLFTSDLYLAIAAITVATAGVLATFPLFWSLPTTFLRGSSGAAAIGFINSMGGVAGFVSPFVVGFLNDQTHNSRYGMWFLAAWLLVAAVLVLRLPKETVNR